MSLPVGIVIDEDTRPDCPTSEQCDLLFSAATAIVRGDREVVMQCLTADKGSRSTNDVKWAQSEFQQYIENFSV